MKSLSQTTRLRQALFAVVTCLIVGNWTPANGQVMVSPAFTEPQKESPAVTPEKQNTWTIHAAAEPNPALRYRFWPAPEDRESGNCMPFVTRALLLSAKAQSKEDYGERYLELYDDSEKLDVEKAKKFVAEFGYPALNEMERAENLMEIQYDLKLQELDARQIVATVLPELQEMRAIARLLDLRARIAMQEGRWDDFCRDVRLNLRLAEIASNSSDFVISPLVGIAIAGMSTGTIEAAIRKPDCPNLYWAIASVPWDQISDVREAIEFESVTSANILNGGQPLPDTPIGEEASRRIIKDLTESFATLVDTGNSLSHAQLVAGVYVVSLAESSREVLKSSNEWADRVDQLSDSEAVLRAINIRFEQRRHNWFKWNLLPPERWDEYDFETPPVSDDPQNYFDLAVYTLLPAINACRKASLRSTQTRNYLLTIEAIRMHASTTDMLPESLEGLKPVPVWMDSIAMKPFQYQKHNDRSATIIRAKRYSGDQATNIKIKLAAQGDQK